MRTPPAVDGRDSPAGMLRRRWFTVSLVVIVCLGIAVGAGLVRTPSYTASTRLVVASGVALPPRSGFGSVQDASRLAATYSRAATAQAVIDPVGRAVGLSPQEVASRISASPVPESPVFSVAATGSTEQSAIGLANSTTEHLVNWIVRVTDVERTTSILTTQIDDAADVATEAEARAAQAAATGGPGSPQARQAQAQALAARTRLEALTSIYGATVTPTPLDRAVDVLNTATEATNDRMSFLQKLVVAALLSGVGLGLALAALLDARTRPVRVTAVHGTSIRDAPEHVAHVDR